MALLQQGAVGGEVRRLQEALTAAGFPVTVDGVYGPRTSAAVQAWKRSKGYGDINGSVMETTEILGGTPEAAAAPTKGSAIENEVRAKYGYLASYLDHPEVGPILKQAAQEGWDAARLQGALYATNWWKTTSQTQRAWEALNAQDPAEAQRQVTSKMVAIQDLGAGMGVSLTEERLRQIATDSIRYGWSDAELRNALGSEFRYQPGGPQVLPAQLKQIAASYMVPLTDADLENWGREIVSGGQTQESFKVAMQTQAKALFPVWASAIDAGAEVRTLMAPYVNLAAEELERSAEDIFNDRRVLAGVIQGAGEGKLPSMNEWTRSLRQLPEWKATSKADNLQADWKLRLLNWFGKAETA